MIIIRFVFDYFNSEQINYKFPRKKSFKKNLSKINPNCLKQNELRSKLKKIIPKEMKSIEDNVFGVDFEYNGITIDQKFSFGDLGNNFIKIRVKNRKLLNKSNYTMCINKNEEIEIFQTPQLSNFVKKYWGIVQKNRLDEKKDYINYKINLNDFYKLSQTICYKSKFNKNDLEFALYEITKNNKYLEKNNLNKTIINNITSFKQTL